ncbi:MAG: hypothetical protein Q9180_005022, partial [Flavoplaca navasiana]
MSESEVAFDPTFLLLAAGNIEAATAGGKGEEIASVGTKLGLEDTLQERDGERSMDVESRAVHVSKRSRRTKEDSKEEAAVVAAFLAATGADVRLDLKEGKARTTMISRCLPSPDSRYITCEGERADVEADQDGGSKREVTREKGKQELVTPVTTSFLQHFDNKLLSNDPSPSPLDVEEDHSVIKTSRRAFKEKLFEEARGWKLGPPEDLKRWMCYDDDDGPETYPPRSSEKMYKEWKRLEYLATKQEVQDLREIHIFATAE